MKGIASNCSPNPYGCVFDQRNPSTVRVPKKVITGIRGPHNILITPYQEVYITGYFDKFLYRLDLAGNIKERFRVPAGNPCMLDLRGNDLYITNVARTVYCKKLVGPERTKFSEFMASCHQPVGFRISADGTRVFVGEWTTGVVRIFDNNLRPIGTINLPHPDKTPRKILYDADGNVNIPGYSSRIYVYRESGIYVRTINHCGVRHIDGFVNNCDGSRVLADRGGKVVFATKFGSLQKVIRNCQFRQPTDVAIAPDKCRTLWVADVIANKVFLF